MPDPASLEPLRTVAASIGALLTLVAWGFGEAIFLPVVPDVLIGILAMAAPEQTWLLLLAATIGGVGGALVLWRLIARRPDIVDRVLAAQPGLGQRGIAEAEARLTTRGFLGGFAQVGPGIPLKAYVRALATLSPKTRGRDVGALAFANRLARLGPVAIAFALLHPAAVVTGWPAAAIAAIYVLGWSLFYVGYWIARDPRRRP